MQVLRGIEVRADTVFKPGVTELFGDVLRLTAVRERRLGVTLPVMEDLSANIVVAAIFRALQTKHETDSTDERIDGLMLDGNAHGRRIVGIEHATVHH